MNQARYISVDDIQAQTTLQEAAVKCGVTIDTTGNGKQVRIDCPFGCPADHAGKRDISIDTSNPQKVFCCHSYGCQARGNMMTLMHGWLTGTLPTGGKLKGDEFKRVRDVLTGTITPLPQPDARPLAPTPDGASAEKKQNIPLAESENEKARELTMLDDKFIVDVATMAPAAATYVRRHPCLSPEMMQKWRIGVLPADGGADKRGWSLRGQVLYPVLAEDGQLLAWIARDPQFELKEITFNALSPEGRAKEKKPAKHRFPVDFQRGLELFGQHASRLTEPGYREIIQKCGIQICEGFNDVLGLDALGIPAVAIMSNKITVAQVTKIERWAKRLAGGKVSLLFDADDAGDEGAKESLWLLAQRGLDVRLGWSRSMHSGQFGGRQPESLMAEEWETAIGPAIRR